MAGLIAQSTAKKGIGGCKRCTNWIVYKAVSTARGEGWGGGVALLRRRGDVTQDGSRGRVPRGLSPPKSLANHVGWSLVRVRGRFAGVPATSPDRRNPALGSAHLRHPQRQHTDTSGYCDDRQLRKRSEERPPFRPPPASFCLSYLGKVIRRMCLYQFHAQ